MATRKVLQEISVFPPQAEEPSFVVVPEEAIPDACHPVSSFPPRAHAKYISSDESKENITPADFDTISKETYKYEKSDVGKPEDLMEPEDLGDGESSGSGSHVKDGVTLEMAAGGESITPRKDASCSDWRIGASDTPLDFSQVTVDDFGISSESFTNSVGRSPRSLHKHRRRSTIGVRGSPEMNFLIRQIALQRSNRKSILEPPSIPFISPRNSVLKEKMSSFRNAFQAVEESEGKLPFPGFTEEIEETPCVTQGSNIYGNTCENVEPPEKRKRVCDASLSDMKSVPVMSHPPLLSTETQKTTQEIEQVPVMEKISESEDESASRLFSAASKSVNLQNEEVHPVPSSKRGRKRKVMFANLLSPPESMSTLCHNQTLKFDCLTSSSPVLRPALKKISSKELMSLKDELRDQRVCFSVTEPLENENNTLFKKTVIDSVKRRKRVTFGRELSPELFDKTLPANTPLRKGSTPYRLHATDTATPTAQEPVPESPSQSLSQPDFDCRDDEDTFKPLSLCFDTGSPSQDSTMLLSPPGKNDQILPIEGLEDETQENSHKEDHETLHSSYNFPENTTTAAALGAEIVNESFIASEPDILANSIVTRSSNKSKQACSSEDLPTSDNSQTADTRKVQLTTTKQSSKRGRKPVLVKCVQVKVPRGQGKKGRGRPKKSIQKPLYGEREIASKKPLLSPIPELPECYSTPSASVHVSHGGTLKKGLVKRVPKRKVIQRGQKSKAHVDLFSGSANLKVKDVAEDPGCPEQEDLAGKHTEPLSDSQEHTEPADLVVQVVALSAITECPLSAADEEMKHEEACIPKSGDSVPEDKSTIETITALKPQNKSKRRSTTRSNVSQTTTELPYIASTETPTELIENRNADHNTVTITEDPKPERDLLVEDQAQLLELPAITDVVTGRKGRRSSRNYRKAAIFCPSTEPNIHTQDPCAMLPHTDENSTTFTIEPCLPIDEILQSTGTEKKVRRSMRLRRDSGASGLFWVQETTGIEGTSRRKSFSSALQPLGNSNLILESVSYSPNKEQLPSASKRRSLSSRRIPENVTYSSNEVQLNIHQLPNVPERRSLSSTVQSLESSERFLENVSYSPNKEQLNVQQVPSESKKTRRRTLCISSLQQASSLCDPKRRRSNVYYRNACVPSAETQTCHNSIMIDT
ncbi:cell division cycle-associated protein 2 [Mantella aurantiaca]